MTNIGQVEKQWGRTKLQETLPGKTITQLLTTVLIPWKFHTASRYQDRE